MEGGCCFLLGGCCDCLGYVGRGRCYCCFAGGGSCCLFGSRFCYLGCGCCCCMLEVGWCCVLNAHTYAGLVVAVAVVVSWVVPAVF